MMDSAGVMPEPATMKAWCRPVPSGVNFPCGGRTSSVSPGLSSSTSRAENRPFSTRRTPMRGACAGGRADRVGAAFLGAVDLLAEGEVLAGPEREGVGEVRRHVEGDGDRVRAEPVDAGDRQLVEGGAGHQISLTCSNGSRQSSQRRSALQAVDEKRESSVVLAEPQRGQRTRAARRREVERDRAGFALRRRDAVLGELAPAVVADPVGRPGRRERGADLDLPVAGVEQLARAGRRASRRARDSRSRWG